MVAKTFILTTVWAMKGELSGPWLEVEKQYSLLLRGRAATWSDGQGCDGSRSLRKMYHGALKWLFKVRMWFQKLHALSRRGIAFPIVSQHYWGVWELLKWTCRGQEFKNSWNFAYLRVLNDDYWWKNVLYYTKSLCCSRAVQLSNL